MTSSNATFQAIRSRQSIRRFSSKPLPERMLGEILELSNRAPSAFNLQPWHFILVRNPDLRRLLHHIALEQDQVAEAPATVVFVTDPRCWTKPYQELLRASVAQGIMTEHAAAEMQKTVRLKFRGGIFGLSGFFKRLAAPVRQLSRPTGRTITSGEETKNYMREQTIFAVSTFVIACQAVDLATCVIDQFDEERLKKLLGIPRRMSVTAMAVVGYPMEGDAVPISLRTPIQEKLSLDLFVNKVSLMPKKKFE